MTRTPSVRSILLRVSLLVIGLGLLAASGAELQAQRRTIKVLFIGNSYTFYNNLPALVSGISRSKPDGPIIEATFVAVGGSNLAYHLKNGPAMAELEKGGWDYVNLQENSTLNGSTVNGKVVLGDPNKPDGFYESAREWVKRIRAKGATPVLEMTWARRDNPGTMQQDLAKIFAALGNELGVKVLPVGLAWEEARWRLRTFVYHFEDGSHPTEGASYLSAAVIYAALTGHDPRGAPPLIMGYPVKDDRVTRLGVVDTTRMVPLVELPPKTAAEFQNIAWDVVTAAKLTSSASTPADERRTR